MMKYFLTGALIAVGLMSTSALAQGALPTASHGGFDLSAGFTAVRANAGPGECGCFFMLGGSAEGVYQTSSGLGYVVDFSRVQASGINGANRDLNLTTIQAGGRYTRFTDRRYSPYIQALLGAGLLGSTYQLDNNSKLIAFSAGGGIDYRLSSRFSVKPIEAEYLGTLFPNGKNDRQNQIRLTAGLTYHFRRQ